jgi:hypothetical protein
MTRLFKWVFVVSVLSYYVSVIYIRYEEGSPLQRSGWREIYALPWDAWPFNYGANDGRDHVLIQIGVLSSTEVADLFRRNAEQFPHTYEGTKYKLGGLSEDGREYVVLRLKNQNSSCKGDIKCYFSCFPYSVTERVSLQSGMEENYNIILPYPEFLAPKDDPCRVSARWGFFFGH